MVLSTLIETTVCRIHGSVQSRFESECDLRILDRVCPVCKDTKDAKHEKTFFVLMNENIVLPDVSEELFLRLVWRSLQLSDASDISDPANAWIYAFRCPCYILKAYEHVWFNRADLMDCNVIAESNCLHASCLARFPKTPARLLRLPKKEEEEICTRRYVCGVYTIVNAFRLANEFFSMISLTSLRQTKFENNRYSLPINYRSCGGDVDGRCATFCGRLSVSSSSCQKIFNDYVTADFYRPDGPFIHSEVRFFGIDTTEREVNHRLAFKRFKAQKKKEKNNPTFQDYIESILDWGGY